MLKAEANGNDILIHALMTAAVQVDQCVDRRLQKPATVVLACAGTKQLRNVFLTLGFTEPSSTSSIEAIVRVLTVREEIFS